MKAVYFNSCLLLLSVTVFFSCTSNPVGENGISSGKSSIKGQVKLSEMLSPDNVFVWLEGFDIGTRTDAQGNFQFILPPPGAQSNSKGVTGAFMIYYYVDNYALASTQVSTQNGFFIYSTDEINDRGELRKPKFMLQRLKVSIKLSSTVFSNSELSTAPVLLRVDVALSTTTDSVVVFYPGLVNDIFGPLLFRNVETNDIQIVGSQITAVVSSALDTLKNNKPLFRSMVLEMTGNRFASGQYEVMPYVLVHDQFVPPNLIDSIGQNVKKLGPDYIELPIKREGSERFLTITD